MVAGKKKGQCLTSPEPCFFEFALRASSLASGGGGERKSPLSSLDSGPSYLDSGARGLTEFGGWQVLPSAQTACSNATGEGHARYAPGKPGILAGVQGSLHGHPNICERDL